jgi:hypothetical protein
MLNLPALSPFLAVLLIPTGVGAAQGGYGGDATVWLNLLASCCDGLVTHPNVANAAMFQRLPANALYVEGYALNQWMAGQIALQPTRQQRLGVILDAGMEAGMKVLHQNTLNAVQTVYGLNIVAFTETSEPLDLSVQTQSTGASSGCLKNPQVLLNAAQTLVDTGATALAVCARLVEPEDSTYSQGEGADPIAGLEAIVSHTLVQHFGLPCANAPVFDWQEAQPRRDALVDPRTAPEYITATFLPSVLLGLSKAPHFMPLSQAVAGQAWFPQHVGAVVVPASCVGGPAVLSALQRGIPIITVAQNTTVQTLDLPTLLGDEAASALKAKHLWLQAQTYYEAAGFLQMLRLGLTPPQRLGVVRLSL